TPSSLPTPRKGPSPASTAARPRRSTRPSSSAPQARAAARVRDRVTNAIRPTLEALLIGSLLAAGVSPALARGPTLPEIRMPPGQAVAACVTPGRLMRHVLERTPDLNPAFRDIARYYKQHGEALRI